MDGPGETACGDIPPEEVKKIEDKARMRYTISSTCEKCRVGKSIIVFRKESTCWECFEYLFIRKFKQGLNVARKGNRGKGEHVLLAFSGGPSSRAMLNLMAESISTRESKDTFYTISVLHIDESVALGLSDSERKEKNEKIREIVKPYGIELHHISLENVNSPNLADLKEEENKEYTEKLKKLMQETNTNTSKEDILADLRNLLIVNFAKSKGFDKVLFGSTATRLTINLIASTCKGKGFITPEQLATVEKKFNDVSLIRPMRDMLSKEIAIYNRYKKLECIAPKSLDTLVNIKFSIDHLTEGFIEGLQSEFPHTVHTVLRSGSKLCLPAEYENSKNSENFVCPLCLGSLSPEEIARVKKFSHKAKESCSDCNCGNSNSCKDSDVDVKNFVCYGCRRVLDETNPTNLPPVFFKSVDNLSTNSNLSNLRDQIKDFLLDDSA